MSYTVKKLSAISGVSVRALHWYDEIGLLKPAYYAENGYRYYEEEQLLLLQQILFYRELGFPLNDIKGLLEGSDFDVVKALNSHRKALVENLASTKVLIKTIDKTLSHLRGKKMKQEELFYGFDSAKQKGYEAEISGKYGKTAEKLMAESKKNTKAWKQTDFDKFKSDGDRLNKALAAAIEDELEADSDAVQELVKEHHHMIKSFYTPTKEVYQGLGDLYCEHADFRKMYESYNPRLPEFLATAMKIFAEREL